MKLGLKVEHILLQDGRQWKLVGEEGRLPVDAVVDDDPRQLFERARLHVQLLDRAAQGTLGRDHPRLRVEDLQALVQLLVVHGQVVEPQDAREGVRRVVAQVVLVQEQLREVEEYLVRGLPQRLVALIVAASRPVILVLSGVLVLLVGRVNVRVGTILQTTNRTVKC